VTQPDGGLQAAAAPVKLHRGRGWFRCDWRCDVPAPAVSRQLAGKGEDRPAHLGWADPLRGAVL